MRSASAAMLVALALGALTSSQIGIGASFASSLPLSSQEIKTRIGLLATALLASLIQQTQATNNEPEDQWLAADDPKPDTRDLANAALEELALGRSPKMAAALLRREFSAQNIDKTSDTYGEIPWTINDDTINDLNGDEFANQAIGPILSGYYDQLNDADPNLVNQIKSVNIPASIVALKRQLVSRSNRWPSYTNMTIMLSTDLILESEAIGDSSNADEGYGLLDRWIAYTQHTGITEFSSPTYYATDLNSLYIGYLYAKNPLGRAKFKAALDCFWSDIAASDFLARGCLAGAHSRDYDFLYGDGPLNVYMYLVGLRPTENLTKSTFEEGYILAGLAAPDAYRPSEQILGLATSGDRTVWENWGAKKYQDRVTYITDDYAIGTCSKYSGAQDKEFNLDLAAPDDIQQPDISIIPDENDNPFGVVKSMDSAGHRKPNHLSLNATFVQHKNIVLALVSVDPNKLRDETDIPNMSTSIILPTTLTTIMYNGAPIKISGSMNVPVEQNTFTFGVRNASGGAIFRVFQIDSAPSSAPTIAFVSDEGPSSGFSRGALRLRIAHNYSSGDVTPTTRIKIGLLIVAGRFTSDSALQDAINTVQSIPITNAVSGEDWHVTVPNTFGVSLEADRNGETTMKRLVNDVPMSGGPFEINGQDMMQQIWSSIQ